jgi:plasmid stabilization system protein ParE
MSEPRITEQAEADLDELWDYIAQRNEAVADR